MEGGSIQLQDPVPAGLKVRQRISTLLFAILAAVAGLVLIGLAVMTLRLIEVQTELAELRNGLLPRLVKLSQLSQESSASISIAPALSTNPSRFEFETLLSRIKDKEGSQRVLIEELGGLIADENAARLLKKNSEFLVENLQTLTRVVRQQIAVRKRLEGHTQALRRMARTLPKLEHPSAEAEPIFDKTRMNIFRILSALQDPNRARFSRNRREVAASVEDLNRLVLPEDADSFLAPVGVFRKYWSSQADQIYQDKKSELTNEFKIKALVEENSLIANRLLSSANTEFWHASKELDTQIQLVVDTTRFTLLVMGAVVLAFAVGSFFVLFVLQRRVFARLKAMRNALEGFAENRDRSLADPLPDEIGEISRALNDYMGVIDQREFDLAKKNTALEQLSAKLAKYLSPQIYDSIFTGRQEVKVASNRKKLTVFFSDIVDFTETADRLESEELTQLLNHYLTEMSRIALTHGATIDKYIGDAIMVFFGDPDSNGTKADALACVKMAIAMRDRLDNLAGIWRESGIEIPLTCRMGIHTDYCTVGNFGSEDRMDYTIIGGAVNTAARLESHAKPGQILISYETFAHVHDEIQCDEHGEIEVKGIAYPLATYEVVETRENANRQRHRFREERPALSIDMDIDAMNADDRRKATEVLHRALDRLAATK